MDTNVIKISKYLKVIPSEVPSEISSLEEKNAFLTQMIFSLKERLDLLELLFFASRKERFKPDPENMTALFNEVEKIAEQASKDETDEQGPIEVGPHNRQRGKRKPLPSGIPRVTKEIDLPESEKFCKEHNVPLVRIGQEKTEKLDIIPAKVQVIEEVCFTYKCPCCDPGIVKSERDEDPIPKSYATPGLLAFIATCKYEDSLPLYRQEKIFDRAGIEINRTTMARWMIKMGELSQALINLLQEHILAQKVAQVDETTIQVLKEPGRKAETKSFMWALACRGLEPAIVFRYFEKRSYDSAQELLLDFEGYLVCDGYKVYDKIEKNTKATLCGCCAHSRRMFFQAEKIAKKSGNKNISSLASEALFFFRRLYQIEAEVKDKPPDQVLSKRQEKSVPILDRFKDWLEEKAKLVLPSSLIGKAISYTQNQWPKLIRFSQDGSIPIDNNYLEQRFKAFAVGRKNWTFSDTPAGAHASAAIYTLIGSAKANNLDAYSYLRVVFKELPKAKSVEDYEKLLPFNILKHYSLNHQ